MMLGLYLEIQVVAFGYACQQLVYYIENITVGTWAQVKVQ